MVCRGTVARVAGNDSNEELPSVARQRGIRGAEFHFHDFGAMLDLDLAADGIWCSFARACFPNLTATLTAWKRPRVSVGGRLGVGW
jgi:hypothetical protein